MMNRKLNCTLRQTACLLPLVLLLVISAGCPQPPPEEKFRHGMNSIPGPPPNALVSGRNWAAMGPDTVRVPDTQVISDVQASSLTFSVSTLTDGFTVGQILVGNYSLGGGGSYLRRITGITASGDTVSVNTTDVTLTEAFTDASIYVRIVGPAVTQPGALVQLLHLSQTFSSSIDSYFNSDYYLGLSPGTGLDVILEIKIAGSQLTRFRYSVKGRFINDLSYSMPVAGAPYSFNAPAPLGEIALGGLTIFPGIYITLAAQPAPALNTSFAAIMNADSSYGSSVDFQEGVIFDNGTLTKINTYVPSLDGNTVAWDVTGDSSLDLDLWTRLIMRWNGRPGATLGLAPYVRTTADHTPTAGDPICTVTMSMGFDARMDADLTTFGAVNGPPAIALDLIDPEYLQPQYTANVCSVPGIVQGHVADAVSHAALSGVNVSIMDGSTLVTSAVTDASGDYVIGNILHGNYTIVFSMAGYLTTNGLIAVPFGQTLIFETVSLVDTAHAGNGTISGKIIDAVTGNVVPGANIQLRAGINYRTTAVLTTTASNASGLYSLTFAGGNYTAAISLAGYNTAYYTMTFVGGASDTKDMTISEILLPNQMRVVLTWDYEPSDLDSHLVKFNSSNARVLHIYYSNKVEGEANLDVDDVSYEGPETISILPVDTSMKYAYWVHDYTNRYSTNSMVMADSGARIAVGWGARVWTFYVPHLPGTAWKVFEVNRGSLRPCVTNCMRFVSDPGSVGATSASTSSVPGEPDELDFLRNLPPKP